MSRVAITRCENYEYRIVQNAVREVIASSSFPDCKGRKILIKPNILSDSRPEKGITTHPAVVKALAEECFERGAEKVFIGDSPGLHSPHFSPVSSGIAAVCEQTGAQWADFTQDSVSRTLPDGTRIQIASVLDQVDFVISAAKFKTHQLMCQGSTKAQPISAFRTRMISHVFSSNFLKYRKRHMPLWTPAS